MKNVIQFSKARGIMVIVSSVLLITGLVFTILNGGFNLGIDFEPGLNVRVEISSAGTPDIAEVRAAVAGIESATIQQVGEISDNQFLIEVPDDGSNSSFQIDTENEITTALNAAFTTASISVLEISYVGPSISADLSAQGIILIVVVMALILIYIWYRFKFAYAIASVAALIHDLAFIILFIGALQLEVSSATVAAVLTIIGYSLNDTIVIFDRIRENETLMSEAPYVQVVNTSITQSLSRTLITSITTLLAVAAIYIFTTGPIQVFALNLIVGIIVGTYSSIFVASPVLMALAKTKRGQKSLAKAEVKKASTETASIQAGVDSQAVLEEIKKKKAVKAAGKKKKK
jgi:preprotein translocase subunit SecF